MDSPAKSSPLLIAKGDCGNVTYTPTLLAPPSDLPPVVYCAMVADIVHHGHINILKIAATHGRVVVGLLTNEACESYKRTPLLDFNHRREIVEAIRYVSLVIPQQTLDYIPNIIALRPKYVVHGDDWKTGPQAVTRQRVIDKLAEWGGQVIEVPYTKNVSTTELLRIVKEEMSDDNIKTTKKTKREEEKQK